MSEKVAIVTGGASGIGQAVVQTLARQGVRVVIADVQVEKAKALADGLRREGGHASAVQLDVTDPQSCRDAADFAVSEFGGLQMAVNNAGVATPWSLLADVPQAEWQRQVAVNLSGVFNCLQAQIPWMLKGGCGSIVNLASILGVNGMKGRSAYVAVKHGVVGITKACALDYADKNIRINAVAPGYVDTPLLRDRTTSERQEISDLHPVGRLSTDQEQADLINFLLSERASFITGAVMLNDGGFSAR